MRLLLTGATGFVGRNVLLTALREARYTEILVPVRSREKLRAQFLGDGFDTVPSIVTPIITSAPDWKLDGIGKVDHVIHSAGVIFARTREEYFRTNVEGTLSLLRKLEKPGRVLLLSSQAAAGPCRGTRTLKEGDPESPLTWYGESKLEMERLVAAEFPLLDYLSLRPPMIFGPRDQATLPLFKMVRRPLHFKPGFRSKYYSYVSVQDLVTAIFAALDSTVDFRGLPSRYFFVAQDHPISDRQLLTWSAEASGRRGFVLSIPQPLLWGISRVIDTVPTWRATIPNLSVDRAKEIWPDRWVCSSAAFQQKFKWKPVDDLKATLKATREWYVKTGQLQA